MPFFLDFLLDFYEFQFQYEDTIVSLYLLVLIFVASVTPYRPNGRFPEFPEALKRADESHTKNEGRNF